MKFNFPYVEKKKNNWIRKMKSIGENATLLLRNMVLKIELAEKNSSTVSAVLNADALGHYYTIKTCV